jgi:hypothetical protein
VAVSVGLRVRDGDGVEEKKTDGSRVGTGVPVGCIVHAANEKMINGKKIALDTLFILSSPHKVFHRTISIYPNKSPYSSHVYYKTYLKSF